MEDIRVERERPPNGGTGVLVGDQSRARTLLERRAPQPANFTSIA